MPTRDEIEVIRNNFELNYQIDRAGITADTINLKKAIADAKNIDSLKIYEGQATYEGGPPAYTYNGPSAFVPDLETFNYSDIDNDPQLSPKRVEQNMEEASRYSQTCLQMRHEYGEIAKLSNDTRFKGEEFLRLDLVHLQEVAAGLYQLPWKEAMDDRIALEGAISQTEAQISITEEMMRSGATGHKYSGVLSDDSVGSFIQNSAKLARLSTSGVKVDVENYAGITTEYKTNIEYATWLQALTTGKGSINQLEGKLSTAKRREEYLRKDEGFRSHRAAISRQLAFLQLGEYCRQNSALNYRQRMKYIADIFDINLRFLVERVYSLQVGLRDNYNIDISLEVPTKGHILDVLSTWLVRAQNELSKYRRKQRLFIYSAWSDEKISITPRGTNGTPLESFEFDMTVKSNEIIAKSPLLRGVAFEYSGDHKRPVTIYLSPPRGAFANSDRDGQSDVLPFGRVNLIAPGIDLKPQHSDVLWNGLPAGTWKIQGSFDQNVGTIESIVMHMWLAST